MNLDQVVSLSTEVIAREVSGELVMLDLASEQYFGLDPVGTRIWQLLADGATLRTVVDTLLDEYEVSEVQLVADLDALLSDAAGRGLITLRAAP